MHFDFYAMLSCQWRSGDAKVVSTDEKKNELLINYLFQSILSNKVKKGKFVHFTRVFARENNQLCAKDNIVYIRSLWRHSIQSHTNLLIVIEFIYEKTYILKWFITILFRALIIPGVWMLHSFELLDDACWCHLSSYSVDKRPMMATCSVAQHCVVSILVSRVLISSRFYQYLMLRNLYS